MHQDDLERIIETNPYIDKTALDRSRQASRRLAEVGIELGGYRLMHPLDGRHISNSDQLVWTGY